MEFRVYDEGMAYRFISKRTDNYKIYGEQADFTFTENNQIYAAYAPQSSFSPNDKFNSGFEEMYTLTTVNGVIKDKLIMTPMLVVCGNGKKLCIAESDAVNYPGLFLSRELNTDNVLNATFAAYPTNMEPAANNGSHYQIGSYAEYIADCNGARTFPWRVFCVAERDMVYYLMIWFIDWQLLLRLQILHGLNPVWQHGIIGVGGMEEEKVQKLMIHISIL